MESAKLDIMIKEVAIHFMGLEADMRSRGSFSRATEISEAFLGVV